MRAPKASIEAEQEVGTRTIPDPVLQEELRKVAGELMAARRRLTEIAQSLPDSEREALRAVIDVTVNDCLTPAIEDLLSASKD